MGTEAGKATMLASRVKRLQARLFGGSESEFSGVDSVAVAFKKEGGDEFSRAGAVMVYLFGRESIGMAGVVVLSRTEAKVVKSVSELDSTQTMGVLEKEQGAQFKDFENRQDVSTALGAAMAINDDLALEKIQKAASIASRVLKQGALKAIEEALDEGKEVSHASIAQKAEDLLESPAKLKLKVSGACESCFYPIVQSGGNYDVRPSAQTDDNPLSDDVVLVSLGSRFDYMCASISRSFFVDPTPKVRQLYEKALAARKAALAALKPGAKLKDVYATAKAQFDEIGKNVGFALGPNYREASLLVNSKNDRLVEKGMVFYLSIAATAPHEKAVGLKGTVNKLNTVAVNLGDTVLVEAEDGARPLTKFTTDWADVSYYIQDEDEEDDEEEDEASGSEEAQAQQEDAAVIPTEKTKRVREEPPSGTNRDEKQAALMRKRLEEKRRRKTDDDDTSKGPAIIGEKWVAPYKSTREYPDLPPNEIYVDRDALVVFLPVSGAHVPVHISTIKTVVQPEPDKASYLRLNFYVPGQSLKDAPPAMARLIERHGKRDIFIKELLFRSIEQRKLNAAYRNIQELRKRFKADRDQKAEERDLVIQEQLIKDARPPRLSDVTLRPFISGKKTTGTVEIHKNGLRFMSKKHETLDLIFANVKHALFQPCENEVIVLLHFHLKNPIMVGKRKSKDIQFMTEVVDASVALDNTRRSMYDPDELDDEQRQRELRKKLNKIFKDFSKNIEKASRLEFDMPYRDLAFSGVPHREMVLLQPTVHCLVCLTETPFFVVELDHIEHVHFERCTLRASNIDMVVINKDFSHMPWVINAIPINDLDAIQEWLTDCSITYTAGQASLSWKQVMNLVKGDDRFYEDTDEDGEKKPAGWQFLQAEDDDDEEDGEDGDDDDDYSEDEDDDDDEDEDEDSDFGEDEEDGDDDYDEEDDEDAMDWDEMEAQAEADDRAKRNEERAEGQRPKKKARL